MDCVVELPDSSLAVREQSEQSLSFERDPEP